MPAFSVFHFSHNIYRQNNNDVMKNDESIMFKIDTELFLLFKEHCEKKRTTMSHELRQLILDVIRKKENE